jgi:hypothetical protein
VILPLLGLAVGLQVVAGLGQEACNRLMADLMPDRAEGVGEVTRALARVRPKLDVAIRSTRFSCYAATGNPY